MTIPRFEYQNRTRSECVEADPKPTATERLSFQILIVDDEQPILRALSFSLEDSSHRVTTALGGQKALDLLHQKPFDLIITDLNMPGVDGITVLRRAKAIRPRAKVVIMSGSVLSASTRRLLFREANGFLAKPFSLAELQRAVDSCLGSEVLRASPCRQNPCSAVEALPP